MFNKLLTMNIMQMPSTFTVCASAFCSKSKPGSGLNMLNGCGPNDFTQIKELSLLGTLMPCITHTLLFIAAHHFCTIQRSTTFIYSIYFNKSFSIESKSLGRSSLYCILLLGQQGAYNHKYYTTFTVLKQAGLFDANTLMILLI